MLRDKLNNDLKDAMRGGDKLKVSTIRLITAAIKSADIEARPAGKDQIDEGSIVNVMTKMIKQRRDSVEQYVKGNRQDLADKELGEIGIIESYLPKQMDEAAMKAAIAKAIADTGAVTGKDMGKVMGALKAAYAGPNGFRQGRRDRERSAEISRDDRAAAAAGLLNSRHSYRITSSLEAWRLFFSMRRTSRWRFHRGPWSVPSWPASKTDRAGTGRQRRRRCRKWHSGGR